MKLYYFDIHARAEPIRLLLNHAKIDFEDVRLTQEDFAKFKSEGKFEFGQVPALERDGKVFTQSNAIMRLLGKENGFYPEDPTQAWRVDSTLDAIDDLGASMLKAKFCPDADKQKELFAELKTKTIPKFLGVIEKRLTENTTRTHVVGDKYTIADFDLGAILVDVFLNDANDHHESLKLAVEAHPALKEFAENFQKDHADYLASRPKRPF
jgi:glutathione S-transferase